MILVLLGPPGVGKGTQGARIAIHYGIPAISTGAIFRDALNRGTELGRSIQRYRIDKGEYVPDEIVLNAVIKRTLEPDCAYGYLLDGFPRTIPQAKSLDEMLESRNLSLTAVLDFEAKVELIVERFSGRRVCPRDGSTYHIITQPPLQAGLCDLCHGLLERRPDDAPEIVRRRLEVYGERTAPLASYYKKSHLLQVVDAEPEPETVFSNVISLLNALRKDKG